MELFNITLMGTAAAIRVIDVITAVTALLGISIALYSDSPKTKKWSPVVGLVGQPFWVYESFMTHSWGILFVSVTYFIIWGGGIIKYWFGK